MHAEMSQQAPALMTQQLIIDNVKTTKSTEAVPVTNPVHLGQNERPTATLASVMPSAKVPGDRSITTALNTALPQTTHHRTSRAHQQEPSRIVC